MEIENYKLSLDLDFHELTVKGHETIRISNPESSLMLDAAGLDVNSASSEGKALPFEQDRLAKKIKIRDIPIKAKAVIQIEYSGRVSRETVYGFYESRYDSGYLVTTDFEPNGARQLFPCVDNPSFKAEFDIDVTTQKDLVVIANTLPREVIIVDEERVRHVFEKTPKMSTYLVYLGIGKFDTASLKDGGVDFRAFARPNHAKKGMYALEDAKKFLRIFEEYYAIPYPLPKLDLIALPEYAAGAMENWGAITFREVALLIDENSSAWNKRGVTEVLGHEIAHQWFGDLVTMRWWNDLWLNESFATFMEYKMTDRLYPDWNVWSDFLEDTTGGSMVGDSLESTHPIDVTVNRPEEISEIFDEISYGKGASVLRMIESWIGTESFRAGVRGYLSEYKYSNARGSDLWRNLEKASGKPVGEVMEAWVKRPGYPVVSASLNQGKLSFSQERFLLRKKSELKDDSWPVPIVAKVNGKTHNFLLNERRVDLDDTAEVSQIKVNQGQAGFYRVLYDQKLYSILGREFATLDPFDRWGIIQDLFAFLMADKVEQKLYFDFVRQTSAETDYLVSHAVTGQLEFMRFLLPESESLERFYIDYFRAHMERLGLELRPGEKDNDRILRGSVAAGLALVDRNFAQKLAGRFQEYEKVKPDLRSAVAIAYAQSRGAEAFDDSVKMMKRMGNEADIVKIYGALTSIREAGAVERTLDLCISGEFNRADSLYAVRGATRNPYVREATWNWVTGHLETFREMFRGTPYVSSIVQSLISGSGIGREKEVSDYFSRVKVEEAEKGIRKGLELLGVYSDLRRRMISESVN